MRLVGKQDDKLKDEFTRDFANKLQAYLLGTHVL